MAGALVQSRLTLEFYVGTDENGEAIFKRKNFHNINQVATKEQLVSASLALASLQVHTLDIISRNNEYDLLG